MKDKEELPVAKTMLYKGEDKIIVDGNDKEAFEKLIKDGYKDAPLKPKEKKASK